MTLTADPSRAATRRLGRRDGIVAAATVACSVAYAALSGLDATVPAYLAVFATLGAASAVDLAERRVPNRLLLLATPVVAGLFVLAAVVDRGRPLLDAAIGGVLLFAVFLVIHLISPASFGAGDVKIAFVIGMAVCWFGLGQLTWFLLWAWLGLAAVGLPLIRRHGRAHAPSLPFVPFLSVAAAATILLAV